jgi:hypothetical protein
MGNPINMQVVEPHTQAPMRFSQALQWQRGAQSRQPCNALTAVPRRLAQKTHAHATPTSRHHTLALAPSLTTRRGAPIATCLHQYLQEGLRK